MCNLYRMEKAPDAVLRLAREMGVPITFPEGIPNAQPRDVRITERAPILRAVSESAGAGAVEMVERRWSWPGPSGKPVFNFRGEGRRFAPAERCVALADGFYEYTDPPADLLGERPKGKVRKDRWRFSWPGHAWFGLAAIWRADAKVGPDVVEAFSLLTCPPGPDVAPFHDRQVVVLAPADCLRWLDPAVPAEELVRTLPAGTLKAERA
jgi:putative SOS response-associated peptidase YedK